jgi:hypothetical protein
LKEYIRRYRMRLHLGFKIPILVALAVVGFVSRAQADPITWTLEGITSLGTSITGSYVYDADTLTYSDIGITTTAGSIITDTTWTNLAGTHYTGGSLLLVVTAAADDTGADVLGLIFSGPSNRRGRNDPFRIHTGRYLCECGLLRGISRHPLQ